MLLPNSPVGIIDLVPLWKTLSGGKSTWSTVTVGPRKGATDTPPECAGIFSVGVDELATARIRTGSLNPFKSGTIRERAPSGPEPLVSNKITSMTRPVGREPSLVKRRRRRVKPRRRGKPRRRVKPLNAEASLKPEKEPKPQPDAIKELHKRDNDAEVITPTRSTVKPAGATKPKPDEVEGAGEEVDEELGLEGEEGKGSNANLDVDDRPVTEVVKEITASR